MTVRRLRYYLLLAVLAVLPSFASAATSEFRVLFDVDNDPSTGCTVGTMNGIDQVFVTQATNDESTAGVVQTHRLVCSGGALGAPVAVDTTAWPATVDPTSGHMIVETRVPFTAFQALGLPSNMHVAFTAIAGSASQALTTGPGGAVLLFPTATPGRRRAVDFGDPRMIAIDGVMADWGTISPLAFRELGAGDTGFQFTHVWAFVNPVDQFVYFSFRARVGTGTGPTANDDDYVRNQGQPLVVPVTKGVLKNDVDPNGEPLTATKVSEANHGNVTLSPDGSFQYLPTNPASVEVDHFTYVASNSTASSNTAKVTIEVNDKPKVKNTTLTVAENVPNGTVVGTVDVNDEAGDTHTFTIINGNTGGAFAVTALPNGDAQISVANRNAVNFEVNPTFTLTLKVTDEAGLSDTGLVTINVTNVNDAPVASNSAHSVPEDQLLNVPAPGLFSQTSDEDGNTLTLSIVANPANGIVTLNPDGSFIYDSNPNYNGPDSFTWRAFDGTAFSNTATVSITVTPVNDAPTFTGGGNVNSPEDTAYSAAWATAISAGPSDEAGQTLTFNITGNSNPGLFTSGPAISPSGVLAFTPATNANGSATIDVTLSDDGGGTNTSGTVTFTITVTPVDDGPLAVADATTVSEDAAATTINVLANDTDVDAGPISIASVTQPANGTVVITNAGADLTYAPNANYCNNPPGTTLDTFTYTLTPGGSATTVTMTVTCVDDNPLAVADAATVNEDSGANTINVLANDTDVDAGAMSITSVTQPANGTVAITNAGADLTYTPNANYCNNPPGTTLDTFTYTLTPGGSSTAVTMTVTCVDDNPLAVADAATVNEDSGATTINVLANDTDIDAGPKSVTSVTQPANGTVVITNAGADLTYAPSANYCNNPPGTTLDTFTYTLTPGGSSTTVTMTVTCINDGPTLDLDADNSGGTAGADYAVTFTEGDSARLLEDAADATVADVDNANLVSLTVTITNILDAGLETLSADVTGTSITANYVPGTGVLTLTGPDTVANFQTVLRKVRYINTDVAPDTTARVINFVANDGATDGNTAVSTVTVVAIDTAPTAVADSATVGEDAGAIAVPVLANDTDPDAGPISITSVTQPANGAVVITGGGTGLTYAPNANYCNTPPGTTLDTFTYTLTPGGASTTVTMTVTCVDDNPLAVADAATVGEDSGATAVNVLSNDTDVDGGPISITSVTQPANGAVVITGGGTGLTYAPNANYCNTPPGTTLDTFTYTLTPGGSIATVTMTVTCVDDNPLAVADTATVAEDSGANAVNVLANDTDVDGGPISITSVTQPASGAVVITGGGTGLTYAPNANYCNNPPGTTLDTFTYTLTPGGSATTVTMTVNCSDDPPVAVADSATVSEDSGATAVNVLANDTDSDGGPTSIASVTQPANGAVVITGGGTGLTYAPNANYCNNPPGTTLDTFTYTLTPGSSSTTVTMTVTCINDGPTLDLDADNSGGTGGNDYAVTFTEGESAKLIEDAVDATVGDIDSATLASMTVTLTNLLDTGFETLSADVTGTSITANYVPGTGVLTLTGPDTLANFQTVLRKVRYVNTDNAPDATARVINFVANDGATNSNTAVSTVTIVPVDSDPAAVNDAATVNEDSGVTAVTVLANDTDADGGPISITSVTQPTNGAVVITGGGTGLTYAPNANYCNNPPGTTLDSFTYTLTPGGSSATVTMTVTCIDDNPVAVADAATVVEDSGATAVNVLANDTDVDAGPISITSVTQPANGAVVITGGGTGLTYAPNANYCNNPPGTTLDTFTYTLTPGGSSTTVTMTVTCVDDNPLAVADATTVVEDSGANAVDVLANDTDVDGGAKSVTSVTQPANGTVVITGGGTGLTYAPNANYCNTPPGTTLDTFTYTLTPGGSSTTVTVNVTCVDDPPVAVNDAATVVEDSGATAVPVLSNDTDIDAGPISITSVTQPTNGTVVITGGGTGLTYAPNLNYCNNPPGTTLDTFTYTLTPGGSVATVTMTVTCVNDPPLADNDTFDFIGNTDLSVDNGALATPHALETTGTTFGVLDGDSDPVEGNNIAVSSITVGACTDNSAPFDCTDAAVGRVQMQANGRFIFTPAAGDTGATETFQYTVTDDGTPAPASTTATVTFTRFERVWYVDGDAPGGGTGTASAPFNNFDALDGAGGAGDSDLAGDYIFVHTGAAIAASAAVPLEANQRVLGQGVALSIPVNLNGNGSPTNLATAGTQPTVAYAGGALFTIGNAVPVEIRGLGMGGGSAVAMATNGALSGSSTLTISDNTVLGAGGTGIGINLGGGTSGTLALAITNNTWNTGGTHTGNAIDVVRAAGTLNANISNNTNVLSSATAINVNGAITITGFSGNTVHGDTAGSGITVTSATFDTTPGGAFQTVSGGTTAIGSSGNSVGASGFVCTTCAGDLSFTGLTIYANGGAALRASGSTPYTGSAGLRIGSAATGDVYSANGGPAVDLSTVTMNSITPTTITSTNSATTGLALNSVLGTFTAGSGSSISGITSGAGTSFQVGSSNASITYAGTITATQGKGVDLTSNTGSTISFTGAMSLSTGTSTAFNATGGGTVTATNTTSTLTTTTGTALNVASTTIGATHLVFQGINVDGDDTSPTNGISLNTTGSSGGLRVLGTGAVNSGGTIRDTSGDGILLNSTAKLSLVRMNVTSNLGSGIKGTTVNGFVIDNSSITSNGDNAAFDESGISLTDLTGTAFAGANPTSITNTTISNNWEFEATVTNNSGTLTDLQMSGNTLSADGTQPNHGNLMTFQAFGSANMTLNATSGNFTGNTDTSGGKIVTATGLMCDHSGTSGTVTCNVSSATFTNNNVGPQGSVASGGAVVVDFNGNTINGSRAFAVNFFADANSPFTKSISGFVRNNIIGSAGANSGSQLGPAIRVQNEGSVPVTLRIENNTIENTQSFQGINVNVGISIGTALGAAATNLSIINNSFANIGSRAIAVNENDLSTGAKATVCVDMSSNNFGAGIVGQAGDGSWVRIKEGSGTVNVRQATPTTGVNAAELDDQQDNGNDAGGTKYAISGTPQFSQPACPQP